MELRPVTPQQATGEAIQRAIAAERERCAKITEAIIATAEKSLEFARNDESWQWAMNEMTNVTNEHFSKAMDDFQSIPAAIRGGIAEQAASSPQGGFAQDGWGRYAARAANMTAQPRREWSIAQAEERARQIEDEFPGISFPDAWRTALLELTTGKRQDGITRILQGRAAVDRKLAGAPKYRRVKEVEVRYK
jgi:hypothetical protein